MDQNSSINETNIVEKPKKAKREITEKQREALAKARETRKALKIVKSSTKTVANTETNETSKIQSQHSLPTNYLPQQFQYIPQPIHIPVPTNTHNSDFIKLTDDIQFIKQHLLEKKRLKEQKLKKQNSIDVETFDDENQKLQHLEKIKSLQNNFIR